MIRIALLVKLSIFLFFISLKAYSFSSSSYLIAQSAVALYDYETASKHYELEDLSNVYIQDLQKKLVAFVNANYLSKASVIAKKIIDLDITNQKAWLIYLADAKLKKKSFLFKEFEKLELKEQYNIINFIYYNNGQIKQNNDIAKAFFDIIKGSEINEINPIQEYDFLLFYLTLALNFNPTFNEALFFKANFYQQIKNYEMAEKIYQKIIVTSPLYLEARQNIAFNKIEKGNIEEAEKILILLIQNNQGKERLIISLADFYRITKQYDKAILHYTDVIESMNNNNEKLWRTLYMRGICFERKNQWVKAEKDFLYALELEPDIPQVLNYLAYGWIERDIFIDRSLEMLKIASQKNPDSHYILDSLAWAYFKKNNLTKAVKLMEEVITKAPGEAISLDHLGDIYFALGRKREAYFMWNQAKDLAEPEDEISDTIQLKLQKYNAG